MRGRGKERGNAECPRNAKRSGRGAKDSLENNIVDLEKFITY
jgi:hypothetical protein